MALLFRARRARSQAGQVIGSSILGRRLKTFRIADFEVKYLDLLDPEPTEKNITLGKDLVGCEMIAALLLYCHPREQAGVQKLPIILDSRLRGNDVMAWE